MRGTGRGCLSGYPKRAGAGHDWRIDQGLHVDAEARSIGLWTTMWVADLFTEIERLWPGWQVTFWADEYERHAELAGDAVQLAGCDERESAARYPSMLDEYSRTIDFFGVLPQARDRARRNLDAAIANVRRELNLT